MSSRMSHNIDKVFFISKRSARKLACIIFSMGKRWQRFFDASQQTDSVSLQKLIFTNFDTILHLSITSVVVVVVFVVADCCRLFLPSSLVRTCIKVNGKNNIY